MNKSQIDARHKALASALGSVRAEGLNPSAKVQKQLQSYAEGKITAEHLRSAVVGQVKSKLKPA